MNSVTRVALLVAAVGLAACGGGSDGGDGTCTATTGFTFTISNAGVTPRAGCVQPGGTITYVNQDTVNHTIEGSAGACASLGAAVTAGQSSSVAAPSTAVNCTFHDADAPGNTAFQGQLAVTTGSVTGPGH